MVVLPTRPLCLLYTVIVIPIHSQRAFFITFVDLKTVGSESLSPSIVMSMSSLDRTIDRGGEGLWSRRQSQLSCVKISTAA